MATDSGKRTHVLLAIDGESHTRSAVAWALRMAEQLGLSLTAVHVKDPYLKQFYNDIYAQGREEYLAHVERCLMEKARLSRVGFEQMARESPVSFSIKVLEGNPLDQLAAESQRPEYALLVLGRKHRSGIQAWKSRNLPRSLTAAIPHLPVLTVPSGGEGA